MFQQEWNVHFLKTSKKCLKKTKMKNEQTSSNRFRLAFLIESKNALQKWQGYLLLGSSHICPICERLDIKCKQANFLYVYLLRIKFFFIVYLLEQAGSDINIITKADFWMVSSVTIFKSISCHHNYADDIVQKGNLCKNLEDTKTVFKRTFTYHRLYAKRNCATILI